MWIFILGLFPQWVAYVLATPGAGAARYVAYQHMVEKDWLDPPAARRRTLGPVLIQRRFGEVGVGEHFLDVV